MLFLINFNNKKSDHNKVTLDSENKKYPILRSQGVKKTEQTTTVNKITKNKYNLEDSCKNINYSRG